MSLALQPCRLCKEPSQLQESHVIPSLVYRWLKETSATGYLRFGDAPNRRVQDGHKNYWLCRNCEQRLNAWETRFANKVFYPLLDDGGRIIRHGEWLSKFCISVSWRALTMFREQSVTDFSDRQRDAIDSALSTWAKCLLGEAQNLGRFEQHFLPLDSIPSGSGGRLPPNINRYILRTVAMDVVRSESTSFVFTKMGKFLVLGFIDVVFPRQWVGTKVGARSGTVGGARAYTMPVQFRDYLVEKAQRYATLVSSISPIQQKKMDQSMWKDLDRVARSGSFEAMRGDVERSGKAAFEIHRPPKRPAP